MRKTLLFGALALGLLGMNGQTISVTVDGEAIENGATVNSYEYMMSDKDSYNFQFVPEVIAVSTVDDTWTVSVKNTTTDVNEEFQKEYEEKFFGDNPYSVQFCWPTTCTPAYGPGETKFDSSAVGANAIQPLQIESGSLSMAPYDGFSVSCMVTIAPRVEGSSPFTFTLNMIYEGAGVDGINADSAQPVYYNLNGVKVNNPEKGIYIEKRGAVTTKVAK